MQMTMCLSTRHAFRLKYRIWKDIGICNRHEPTLISRQSLRSEDGIMVGQYWKQLRMKQQESQITGSSYSTARRSCEEAHGNVLSFWFGLRFEFAGSQLNDEHRMSKFSILSSRE